MTYIAVITSMTQAVAEQKARAEAAEAKLATAVKALEWYADPEIYRPHPHGIAFDRRDLSYHARATLKEIGGQMRGESAPDIEGWLGEPLTMEMVEHIYNRGFNAAINDPPRVEGVSHESG